MRLRLRSWGEESGGGGAERTVLLVHGLASDSGTWEAVAPRIARLGYRVLAPDLRGHGRSPRGYYSPRALADDLCQTLPVGAALALGHSVGAAVLSLAAGALAPRRLGYAEPYWDIDAVSELPDASSANRLMAVTPERIAAQHPTWPERIVAAEAAARARWDPRTMVDLHAHDMPRIPGRTPAPSLVLRAGIPGVAPELDERELARRGFEVVTLPGAGHLLHHDEPEGFMAVLGAWLGSGGHTGGTGEDARGTGAHAAR
ncbi:alpha/beta hydrolase [Streptomyces albus subsp. chlorinus]|uniref:Alpha/beta hydrolase fold protein n=1 Tax=Streptomyces albus subsp. chlorinus TaxID=337066 RepID=A0A386KS37_9ACTN|nr:alpha/beta hydrolase [Streptomyces albus]AYD88523.1 alpha/beta hydrolase fold protein [Streptomyces albus subsp. chlorinus]NSC25495.1 alpha/beta hydrolase [Streptomyces albus subsp. chlorinus]